DWKVPRANVFEFAGFPGVEDGAPAVGGQIGGVGVEHHVSTILRDPWSLGWSVPFALGADADPGGAACLAVVEKYVRSAVGVAWHQVVGIRFEDHEPPVVRDPGPRPSGFRTVLARRDSLRRLGDPIPYEHVRGAIRVSGNEIAGSR